MFTLNIVLNRLTTSTISQWANQDKRGNRVLVNSLEKTAQAWSRSFRVMLPRTTDPGRSVPVYFQTALNITSFDPSKIVFSSDPTVRGASPLLLTLPADSNSVPFYVQSIGSDQATYGYTVSAPGVTPSTSSVTVNPSGFVLSNNNYSGFTSFDTAVGAADYTLSVSSARLDPRSLNVIEYETIVPGFTNTQVQVTSSSQSVGTITNSPLAFQGGEVSPLTTSFHAVGTGSSVIHVSAPAPFSVASTPNDVTANVH